MQCHTNGGPLVWDWRSHDDMADAFADVAGDREIKVLIHTGTGDSYNASWGRLPDGSLPDPPLYDAMPGVRGCTSSTKRLGTTGTCRRTSSTWTCR